LKTNVLKSSALKHPQNNPFKKMPFVNLSALSQNPLKTNVLKSSALKHPQNNPFKKMPFVNLSTLSQNPLKKKKPLKKMMKILRMLLPRIFS
jgi:hypothetical protein